MVVLLLVLELLAVLEIDLLLLAFLLNACLLVDISCSENDMAVLHVLVVQLAVANEEEEAAVSAVPDRGVLVMTVHLGGVRHMGCGDVVVDQFRLGFIVIYSIFD